MNSRSRPSDLGLGAAGLGATGAAWAVDCEADDLSVAFSTVFSTVLLLVLSIVLSAAFSLSGAKNSADGLGAAALGAFRSKEGVGLFAGLRGIFLLFFGAFLGALFAVLAVLFLARPARARALISDILEVDLAVDLDAALALVFVVDLAVVFVTVVFVTGLDALLPLALAVVFSVVFPADLPVALDAGFWVAAFEFVFAMKFPTASTPS